MSSPAGTSNWQTVGKALHILEREELIHRVVGLGYYTTSPNE
jgi:DNA-binding GntR family transcriptional regulator